MAPRTSTRSSSAAAPPVISLPTTRSRKTSTVAGAAAAVELPTTTRSKIWNSASLGQSTPAKTPSRPLWGMNKSLVDAKAGGTPSKSSLGVNKVGVAPATPALRRDFGLGIGAVGGEGSNRIGNVEMDEDLREEDTRIDFEKRGVEGYDPSREPIKTYLRVRPSPTAPNSANYFKKLNDSEVLMVPPVDHRLNPSSISSSFLSGSLLSSAPLGASETASIGTVYKFTRVFTPSSLPSSPIASSFLPQPSTPIDPLDTQATFFAQTTLPLLRDFITGQNCLLFAYGPTGSGKTWTVQGGEGDSAGLLPRVMDVVWSSMEGKGTRSQISPSMLGGVDTPVNPVTGPMSSTPTQSDSSISPQHFKDQADAPQEIKVDEAYEYSIWVSYAEVYNEKIYDLLSSPAATPSIASSTHSSTPTSVLQAGLGFLSVKAKGGFFKSFQTVKRNALTLKADKVGAGGTGKYVAGMREVRVNNAQEAKALLSQGQVNRRVFSTLANRVSSRSHSIFTIKIVRILKGSDPDDLTSATCNRFSIVDLAGSERVVNTQTTGERLKEAGNINRSLMVLGQCMEVLRKNQEREKWKKPALVPFRHSKITELFQSFFVGDGNAVMIVNVNPYDTGFDENSHVMRFSAVAKGVMTVKSKIPVRVATPVLPCTPVKKEVRIVRLSLVDGGEEEDVVYEEEDAESECDEEEPEDMFVNALLEELSALRSALFESQVDKIMTVAQTKANITKDYEQRITDVEARHKQRMRDEADHAQTKLNAKLDNLTRMYENRAINTAKALNYDDSDDVESEGEEEEEASDEPAHEIERLLLEEDASMQVVGERSMTADLEDSPLAPRTLHRAESCDTLSPSSIRPTLIFQQLIPDTAADGLAEEAEEEDEEGETSIDFSDSQSVDEPESDEYEENAESEVSEEEYVPAARASTSGRKSRASTSSISAPIAKKSAAKVVLELETVVEIAVEVKKAPRGRGKGKAVAGGEDEEFEVENMPIPRAREQSIELDGEDEEEEEIIRPLVKSKKVKRKLGGFKIKDAELIDSIVESVGPLAISTSNRSLLTNSSSINSMISLH